jgi:hypothetical protein
MSNAHHPLPAFTLQLLQSTPWKLSRAKFDHAQPAVAQLVIPDNWLRGQPTPSFFIITPEAIKSIKRIVDPESMVGSLVV